MITRKIKRKTPKIQSVEYDPMQFFVQICSLFVCASFLISTLSLVDRCTYHNFNYLYVNFDTSTHNIHRHSKGMPIVLISSLSWLGCWERKLRPSGFFFLEGCVVMFIWPCIAPPSFRRHNYKRKAVYIIIIYKDPLNIVQPSHQ